MVRRLCSRFLPGAAIVACLVLYGSPRTDAQGSWRLTTLPRDVVHALLKAYERGEYGAFEELASRHAMVAANWLAFEADAQVWIDESPAAPRRPLIAATVALELADVQRGSWTAARMLVEAGCLLVQRQAPSAAERLWHSAAAALAVSMADFDLLIDDPDLTPAQLTELHALRAETVAQIRGRRSSTVRADLLQFLAHADHAAARFPDAAEFRLPGAVAQEFRRVGEGETIFVTRDIPIWLEPADVERLLAAGDREIWSLPRSRRMSAEGAGRLLSKFPQAAAARQSLALWNVAGKYADLIDEPAVSAEAHLRLGQTFVRLARPMLALSEFAKAEQATDPEVRYLAHLLAGAVHERISQRPQAIASLLQALRVLPRAQAATFALAPLLLEDGEQERAAELMESAVARPTVTDPLHQYWTGSAERWPHARERLREALR